MTGISFTNIHSLKVITDAVALLPRNSLSIVGPAIVRMLDLTNSFFTLYGNIYPFRDFLIKTFPFKAESIAQGGHLDTTYFAVS